MKNSPFIMVVDDDEEILSLVSQTLEQEGYDVATALDGNTALDMVRGASRTWCCWTSACPSWTALRSCA